MSPNMLSFRDALDLSSGRAAHLYEQHVNPSLLGIYKMLGLDTFNPKSASGVEIMMDDGRRVLDFTSAIGILSLGHNHPRIAAAEKTYSDMKVIDAVKVAPSKLQAALGYNLAQMLPDPLKVSFFGVSGAEAVEAALKLARRVQPDVRSRILTTKGSFHGRTHGTLTVTTSGNFRDSFLLPVPEANVTSVDFGSVEAFRRAVEEDRHRNGGRSTFFCAILEPIQGQGVVVPPRGYLAEVAKICREYGILVIFDEIKVGMCRTGPFCAFFDEGVVPDILTLSKALGGGHHAISAMVTSERLFREAYGDRAGAGLHGTTFGGLSMGCAVALEVTSMMADPAFAQDIRQKGAYLTAILERVQAKYPDEIAEVRGRGLLQGVRFQFKKAWLEKLVDVNNWKVFKTWDSLLIASLVRDFYENHNILMHFSATNPDVLHVMPPLVCDARHLDEFGKALSAILERGLFRTLSGFVGANIVGKLASSRVEAASSSPLEARL